MLRIRITLMRIRIPLVILMRIRILLLFTESKFVLCVTAKFDGESPANEYW